MQRMFQRRIRRIGIVTAAAVLLGSQASLALGASSPTGAAAAGDSSGSPVCSYTPAAPRIMALSHGGVETPLPPGAAATDVAKAYHFNFHGDDLVQVVPPAGFKPLTATDAELKAYELPPRPPGGAALAHWESMMSGWKGAAPPEPCETGRVNSVAHYATLPYWAGGMNINNSSTLNTYTKADGEWTEPAFVAVCPAASAYTIWSGLGGYNSTRLIQAGVNTDTALNSSYMFWEVLSSAHPNSEVKLTGDIVRAGDIVEAFESYTAGGTGSAYFFVYDATNGLSASTTRTTYSGANMSTYYEGTTADYITEAPGGGTAPQGRYYLRRPASDTTNYFYAVSNNQPINAFPSWNISEIGASGNIMQSSSYDGIHAWNDYWKSCS